MESIQESRIYRNSKRMVTHFLSIEVASSPKQPTLIKKIKKIYSYTYPPNKYWPKFFCILHLKLYLIIISHMDDEERRDITKQPSQRIPFNCLEQVSSDLVLAMALQEQETSFAMLDTIESESEEENDDDSYNNGDNTHFEYEFFQRSGYDVPELEFIEDDEESSSEDADEEDMEGLDVDELTYEELIALEEFIGVEKRGLPMNEISSCLNPFVCKSSGEENRICNGIDRCVICQVEYEDGEALVAVLPCEHPYHSECISKWLQIKKCCPICSTEVISSSTKKI